MCKNAKLPLNFPFLFFLQMNSRALCIIRHKQLPCSLTFLTVFDSCRHTLNLSCAVLVSCWIVG